MPATVHAFQNDALSDHDAVELARLMRAGELGQVEVIDAAISRARLVQPHLCAVVHELYAQARTTAERARRGVFAGVPVFIKDVIDVKGAPTRVGSRSTGTRAATSDAAFVRMLSAMGPVIVGKSATPEFGFNATTEPSEGPATRNPWHTDYTPGGSSGGSAALVAAGVVPFAHGNDGGGSLRIPAACCGLFALKPSRGRLPTMEGARALPFDIICEGIVSRSVRDTAHFYAEAERQFPTRLPAIGLVEGPSSRRLRVGVLYDSVGVAPTDEPTRLAVRDTVTLLEGLGHKVSELQLPSEVAGFPSDFSFYWAMIAFLTATFGMTSFGRDFDASKLEGLTRGLAARYRRELWRTPAVLFRLKRSAHHYARVMRDYDVVLSPVVAHTTPQLGHLFPEVEFELLFDRLRSFACFTPLNNATGSPAMSVPVGMTSANLPVGVHFSAAHGDERTLLELAHELTQAHPRRRIQDIAPAVT